MSRLLIARYLVLNVLGVMGLAIAWRQGLIQQVWMADGSRLSVAILALFVWATVLGGWRAWLLTVDLDHVGNGGESEKEVGYLTALRRGIDPRVAAEALRTKLQERVAFVRHASGAMVTLGLIGTVIGFIISLQGVDPTRVGDASAIGPMVATMIDGMGVALYTTLVGAVLGIWCSANYRLLATGAANLYSAILEKHHV